MLSLCHYIATRLAIDFIFVCIKVICSWLHYVVKSEQSLTAYTSTQGRRFTVSGHIYQCCNMHYGIHKSYYADEGEHNVPKTLSS